MNDKRLDGVVLDSDLQQTIDELRKQNEELREKEDGYAYFLKSTNYDIGRLQEYVAKIEQEKQDLIKDIKIVEGERDKCRLVNFELVVENTELKELRKENEQQHITIKGDLKIIGKLRKQKQLLIENSEELATIIKVVVQTNKDTGIGGKKSFSIMNKALDQHQELLESMK